jgi:dCTP deaminase
VAKEGDKVLIPPHGFALAESVEYFRVPRNMMILCIGKSTYCRCGIIINISPLEPAWNGVLTVEIANSTDLPALIFANEGLAQLLFFEGAYPAFDYAKKKGLYQNQAELTLAGVR